MSLTELDLHITNLCNLECIHCCYDSGKKKLFELSFEDIEQILLAGRKLGCQHLHLTGGEPLLRKDIFTIIRLGTDLGYEVELLTNGTLLTQKTIDSLISCGLDTVAISLDGGYIEMQKIRKITPKEYDDILYSISHLTKSGIKTKINTVVLSHNMGSLVGLIHTLNDLDIVEQRIYYFSPIGRGKAEYSVNPRQWLDFVDTALKKCAHKHRLFVQFAFIKNNSFICRAATSRDYLQIMCDGNVYPCAVATSLGPIGNIKIASLERICNDDLLWARYCTTISGYSSCPLYANLSAPSDLYPHCPCKKVELR